MNAPIPFLACDRAVEDRLDIVSYRRCIFASQAAAQLASLAASSALIRYDGGRIDVHRDRWRCGVESSV